MLRVGLTGGYATGKSFVAAELERLECRVIYSDKLGHEVLLASGEAYRPVVELFGEAILDDKGAIDRRKLAAIVFSDAELLHRLNAIVHPAVFRLEDSLIAGIRNIEPGAIVVVEAAILIETGRYHAFDRLIVTVCSLETQIARGMKRDHITREQVLERLQNQTTLEEKRSHADFVVDTDGPKENTIAHVREIHRQLQDMAEQRA